MTSNLHEAARRYAQRGWKIFPLSPGSKKPPAGSHGFQDASSDLEQIDKWWTETPDANIGFEPGSAGLAVIDLDKSKPEFDEVDLMALNLPATFAVDTPSGGQHLYFKGSVPGTTSKLAPAVDTRGNNSYVLLPPSQVEGKVYHYANHLHPAPLPAAIEAKLAQRAERVGSAVAELDLPGNVRKAEVYLRDAVSGGRIAVSGRGGNNLTYSVAARVMRDLGLSTDRAFELINTIWNPHCIPPWEPDELRTIVENVSNYGQNEVGAYASREPDVVFKDYKAKPAPETPNKFQFRSGAEMHETKPPRWIVRDLIPEQSIVLVTASKGSFKTFLAMELAQSIATGISTFGITPELTGPTFYGAHEGRFLIEKTHREAWCQDRGFDPETDLGFYVAPGPRVGLGDMPMFGDAIQTVLDKRADGIPPRLIVLDTYSQCMLGMDENSPMDVGRFLYETGELRDRFGCSILILAHLGKDASRGTRGSNSLEAGVDTVIDLTRTDGTLRVKAKVRHQRNALERSNPWYFQGKQVKDSLVFDPLAPLEYSAMQRVDDPHDARNVSAMLTLLGATSRETAQTTYAVAHAMTKQGQDTLEQFMVNVRATQNALNAKATGSLRHLNEGSGPRRRWFVPPLDEETPPPGGETGDGVNDVKED